MVLRASISLLALVFTFAAFADPNSERDAFKARILALHEAAFKGDRVARAEIKKLRNAGEGEQSDYINVFELLAKVEKAKKPDEFTLLEIGHAYNFGRGGLSIDKKKAVYWYARAARAGSKIAIYNLGLGYFRGNEAQAKDWTLAQGLLQSANNLTPNGDKNSIWTLAAMAKEEEDYDRAFLLYSQLGPMEPSGYWEAAQLAELGKAAAVKEPEKVALDLYHRAGNAGWRRGSAEAGRLYLLSKDPNLRNPGKALQSFLEALSDESPDGSARQVIERALADMAASGGSPDGRPSFRDFSISESYQLIATTVSQNPDLADDWKRFNHLLERYWSSPSDSLEPNS